MAELNLQPSKPSFIESQLGKVLEVLDYRSSASILALALLTAILYRISLHPLAGIPGPRLAALTGLWRSYHYACGGWHDDIISLHQKYGRVVRIAPNEISVVDAVTAKTLFAHGTRALKTAWYTTWQFPKEPAIFATQNPKIHAALRKRVSLAYSMSSILRYEPYIQSCLDLCFVKLKKYADTGRPADMSLYTSYLAFDCVGELGFGQQLGHLKTESDVNNLRATLSSGFKMASTLGHLPGQIFLIHNRFTIAIFGAFGAEDPMASFALWSSKRLEARKTGQDDPGRPDMLSHFIDMKTLDGKDAATDGEVLVESGGLIGAGADTTATGMRACVYYLCKHPEAYKRLQRDIDNYYESSNLTDPINYSQTQDIPFLKAVVAESLRLMPSIPFQLLRYCPEGGLNIEGHYIPAGYVIGISPIAQNQDKAVFGKDSGEFRPERWLDQSPKERSAMENGNLTFGGSGPRGCIGRNISLAEINKFVAQLLRNFDVDFVDADHPWDIETYWFTHHHNMNMNIKLRQGITLREVEINGNI